MTSSTNARDWSVDADRLMGEMCRKHRPDDYKRKCSCHACLTSALAAAYEAGRADAGAPVETQAQYEADLDAIGHALGICYDHDHGCGGHGPVEEMVRAAKEARQAQQEADERFEYLANAAHSVLLALVAGDPKCSTCGNPATCVGAYESLANLELGCDKCCGHGNEDGWCVRLSAATDAKVTHDPRRHGRPRAPPRVVSQCRGVGGDHLRSVESLAMTNEVKWTPWTPGPYTVCTSQTYRAEICSTNSRGTKITLARIATPQGNGARADANAGLFAAAPDLAEALLAWMEASGCLRGNPATDNEAEAKARAALRKAGALP